MSLSVLITSATIHFKLSKYHLGALKEIINKKNLITVFRLPFSQVPESTSVDSFQQLY